MVIEGKTLQALDTKTSGYGNFYLQPNGVFAVDTQGRGFVVPTSKYHKLAQTHKIAYATQSGPMMVVDGKINSLFTDGSPNLHIRNAVGITAKGNVVFAISKEPVSFFDLSSHMIQKGCVNVLYLDGFVSKIYLPHLQVGTLADGNSLGPLIAVLK